MRPPPLPFTRVGIVGVGLIGGSIALSLRRKRRRVRVIGIDSDEAIRAARRARAIDAGGSDLALLRGVDLVILAAPVRTNVSLLAPLAAMLTPETIVTDVSSTKRAIVAAADAMAGLTFVGGHPMAGAAVSGFQHARGDLFDGRAWLLTPRPRHAAAAGKLEAFVHALGAVPHLMAAELHDRFVGAVSHLPQLTASALMHTVGKLAGDAGLELAGAGLRDTTRLASSPASVWLDIAATNEDVLRDALDALLRTLTDMRDSLGGGEAMESVFASACRWRRTLEPPE